MSAISTSPVGQNWVITPAPLALNQTPPRSKSEQKWLLQITGVFITSDFSGGRDGVGVPGDNPHDWRRLTVSFMPDVNTPLQYAINSYGIPTPTAAQAPEGYFTVLSLDLWAPFVAISSSVDTTGEAAGCAVDVWRPSPFENWTDLVTGDPLPNVFTGFDTDIAIFGAALLHRLSYSISLVGRIGFLLG